MRKLTRKFSRKPTETPGMRTFQTNAHPAPLKDVSLKDEGLGRSEIYPENSPMSQPSIQRALWLILAFLVLLFSGWLCFLGPAAPVLRSFLENSAGRTISIVVLTFTPTVQAEATGLDQTPSALSPEASSTITSSPTPTLTATITPTVTPTTTDTPTPEPSPTPVPIQATLTPTSEVAGCVPASEVKLSDVGSTICVSGRVVRTIDKPASFLIILVEEPQAFYFVAYDLKYPNLKKNQCVYAIGEIRQLGNNPIMVVSYSVPLQYCP